MRNRIVSIGSLRVSIHPLCVLSLAALCFAEQSVYSFAVILCALLHEVGHIVALLALKKKPRELCFLPGGLELRTEPLSYREERTVVTAGPAANLLCVLPFRLVSCRYGAFFLFCADCSLLLAIFNLLPLRGFDGAQGLKCFLFLHFPDEKAFRITRLSEQIAWAAFATGYALFCLFCGFNLSLTAILLYLTVTAYGRGGRTV